MEDVTTSSKPYFVFIAYSSADAWTASQLEQEIQRLGAETFLSEIDVEGGDDVGDNIRDAMNRAQECAVLYTPEASQSKSVWMEIGGAWMAGKRVVMLLNRVSVQDLTSDPQFPSYLKSLDLLELNTEVQGKYFPQLKTRIETHTSGS